MWLKAEGFKSLILDWWNSLEFRGSGSYVLMERLKALKVKLKSWNKEVFGRVEESKKIALKKLAYWDEVEAQRTLSLNEKEAKVEAIEGFKS